MDKEETPGTMATRHRTNTNKTTHRKLKNNEQHEPHNKSVVNPSDREEQAIPVFYKTHVVFP